MASDQQIIAELTRAVSEVGLPEDKGEHLWRCPGLPGFVLRLRRGRREVSRDWYVYYGRSGKLLIGDCRKITPRQALTEARKRLAAITLGADPAAERAEAKAKAKVTLGVLVSQFLAWKPTKPRKRGQGPLRPRTIAMTELHLMRRWKPLHKRALHELHRRDIAARLTEISKEFGPHAAETARTTLSEFYSWAMQMGLAEANPVNLTPHFAGPDSRERVLDGGELAGVWRAVEDMGEYGTIVRLLILTGARREEIADLRRGEIDLDRGVLEIPGTRTKNHRPLKLALPPLAVEILRSIPVHPGRDRVFGKRSGPFSAWSQAKRRLDARLGAMPAFVLHDLRRSAATGMAEIGVQPHVIEAVLNHVSGHKAGVAGIYNLASYTAEVKTALLRWAEHISTLVEDAERKVIPMAARA